MTRSRTGRHNIYAVPSVMRSSGNGLRSTGDDLIVLGKRNCVVQLTENVIVKVQDICNDLLHRTPCKTSRCRLVAEDSEVCLFSFE